MCCLSVVDVVDKSFVGCGKLWASVFYDTRTDFGRPIDGSKYTNHCLVFSANYVWAQVTVDQ